MIPEDDDWFAMQRAIEQVKADALDPEAKSYVNGLAQQTRVNVAELVKHGKAVAGAKLDPGGDPAKDRVVVEPLTPGMMMLRVHADRPFTPRVWRRITDAERIALCLKPHEDAAAVVQFVITGYVEHAGGHREPVYGPVTEYWLNPDPATVGMLNAFGDGVHCNATRRQMLAAGMRMAGSAQVPGTGPDRCEAGAPASPPPISGPAGAAEEPERESAATREDCDAWE